MAVHIVEDVPMGLGLRRFGRAIAVLLGVCLVAAGLIAAALPVLWIVIIVSSPLTGADASSPSGEDAGVLLLFTAGAIVGLWLGLRLIRGRRRVGLYLRKFGFAETTRTVSHALASAVGRSLRLVTLDDSMVAAVGPSRGRRRAAGLAWLAAAAVVAWLLFYAFAGAYEGDVEGIMEDAISQADGDFGAEIGAVIGGSLIAALLLVVVLLLVSLALVAGLLGGGAYLSARRAERTAVQRLTSEGAIDATARRIAAAGRRIFAARLVVISVPTAFWQRAVRGLAGVSDVVIIDVSQATDNLIWEVQNIKPMLRGRWILVGARDLVAPLAMPNAQMHATPQGLLARLLDGEQIIAYRPDPAGRRRFARALRRSIEQLGH